MICIYDLILLSKLYHLLSPYIHCQIINTMKCLVFYIILYFLFNFHYVFIWMIMTSYPSPICVSRIDNPYLHWVLIYVSVSRSKTCILYQWLHPASFLLFIGSTRSLFNYQSTFCSIYVWRKILYWRCLT